MKKRFSMKQTTLLIPESIMARADKLLPNIACNADFAIIGTSPTRSTVLRMALDLGLKVLAEKEKNNGRAP